MPTRAIAARLVFASLAAASTLTPAAAEALPQLPGDLTIEARSSGRIDFVLAHTTTVMIDFYESASVDILGASKASGAILTDLNSTWPPRALMMLDVPVCADTACQSLRRFEYIAAVGYATQTVGPSQSLVTLDPGNYSLHVIAPDPISIHFSFAELAGADTWIPDTPIALTVLDLESDVPTPAATPYQSLRGTGTIKGGAGFLFHFLELTSYPTITGRSETCLYHNTPAPPVFLPGCAGAAGSSGIGGYEFITPPTHGWAAWYGAGFAEPGRWTMGTWSNAAAVESLHGYGYWLDL